MSALMAKKKSAAKKKPVMGRAARNQKSTGGRPAWKPRKASGIQVIEAPNFAKQRWLAHGFSARPGGESELQSRVEDRHGRKPIEHVLNLGFTEWDKRERVQANRETFFRSIGAAKMRPVVLRQIHSDIAVRVAADASAPAEAPQADALFTNAPGVLLIVQTADCVPILLADTKRRAVAAIHSGWRGTVQHIAAKTLGRMQMEFGTRPKDVIAALGPSIGQCSYEVSGDVAKEFHAKFPNAREWFDGPYDALAAGESDPNWLPWLTMRPPGHAPPPLTVQLDLIAANRAILAEAGVPTENISDSGLCTACRTDLFFSYRREQITGRMMAAIGIR